MANWIQGAIKRPGALRRKAAVAGESTMSFAREHASDKGRTGKQARLAMTLSRLRKRRKVKSDRSLRSRR